MELIKCCKCGKMPRQQSKEERPQWGTDSGPASIAPKSQVSSAKSTPSAPEGELKEGSLETVYMHYCHRAPKADAMDNSKWSKAVVEQGWIERGNPNVDMVFTKIAKKQRKLSFDDFQAGVALLATIKYPQSSSALVDMLASTGTALQPLRTQMPTCVVSRLTDSSQYGGTHKHRFNEDGKGVGAKPDIFTAKIPAGIISGGKRVNLEDIMRNDNIDPALKKATCCPVCSSARKSDQRTCARCGKEFF